MSSVELTDGGERHPGAAVIGAVTDRAGVVELAFARLAGRRGAGFAHYS